VRVNEVGLRLSSSSEQTSHEKVVSEITRVGVNLVIPLILFFKDYVGMAGALCVVALTESALFMFIQVYKYYSGRLPLKWVLSVAAIGTFIILESINRLKEIIGLESAVVAITLSVTVAIYTFLYTFLQRKNLGRRGRRSQSAGKPRNRLGDPERGSRKKFICELGRKSQKRNKW
jgi:hypothetical protein